MKFKEIKDMTLSQIWDKFKKPFNFAWKAGIIVIAVGVTCGLFSELMGWLCCYVEGDSYDIEYVSDEIEVIYYTNGTCRVYDRNNDRRLSKRLKFVDACPPAGDTLTSFQALDGRWGFLSIVTGEIVIPAEYSKVWNFSEGLAAVADEHNRVGFIDRCGKLAITTQDVDYNSDYYYFENDIAILSAPITGLKGAINKHGEWVIPMEYQNICYPDASGFMKVYDGRHWGLYDSTGKEIFPIIYDYIYHDEGYDRVFIHRNGVKQLVSMDGEVIEPFIVDRISPLNYIVEYNLDSVNVVATHPYLVEYEIDSERGVLDSRTSTVIIPAEYDTIEMISGTSIKASLDVEHVESVMFDIHGRKLPSLF